ncbi:PEP-CTERM sorting domain-containing protein [Oryzomonas rubra]|uniref:PEP-CTERM sorting domain-containing protein n=1 Tax=Oryzomonas rubra TaxID=2509454 RepID=UPI001FE68951|nr:PEP-CTERM sorting domain-containing protein [Oryzomonas rubra]
MSSFKNLVISLVVVLSCCFADQALAVPNFNSGFAGWSGQLSDGVNVDAANLASDPHFSLNGNIATIKYTDLAEPYWAFTLSQAMVADQLAGAGNKLIMSFYMKAGFGDAGTFDGHIVSATLGSDALINTTDQSIRDRLIAGDTFSADITNFAGSSELLSFTLGDLDFSVPDYLSIGDFAFSQIAPPVDNAPVPEPSTILLLGIGMAGLVFYRKKA